MVMVCKSRHRLSFHVTGYFHFTTPAFTRSSIYREMTGDGIGANSALRALRTSSTEFFPSMKLTSSNRWSPFNGKSFDVNHAASSGGKALSGILKSSGPRVSRIGMRLSGLSSMEGMSADLNPNSSTCAGDLVEKKLEPHAEMQL